ncbi:hypothetical protein C8R44DRAFT_859481 [Mycena epipterygia]|nr:hypothetical protein C8R44DRAFT_859481 [Mycena epipterygia]
MPREDEGCVSHVRRAAESRLRWKRSTTGAEGKRWWIKGSERKDDKSKTHCVVEKSASRLDVSVPAAVAYAILIPIRRTPPVNFMAARTNDSARVIGAGLRRIRTEEVRVRGGQGDGWRKRGDGKEDNGTQTRLRREAWSERGRNEASKPSADGDGRGEGDGWRKGGDGKEDNGTQTRLRRAAWSERGRNEAREPRADRDGRGEERIARPRALHRLTVPGVTIEVSPRWSGPLVRSVRTKEVSTCEHGAEGWSGGGESAHGGEEEEGRAITRRRKEERARRRERRGERVRARTGRRANKQGSEQGGGATKPTKEEREREIGPTDKDRIRLRLGIPPHAVRDLELRPRLVIRSGGGGSSNGGVGEGRGGSDALREIVLDLDVEHDVDGLGLLVALEGGGVGAGGGWVICGGMVRTAFRVDGGQIRREGSVRIIIMSTGNGTRNGDAPTGGKCSQRAREELLRLAVVRAKVDTGLGHVRARSLIGFVGPACNCQSLLRPFKLPPSCASRIGNFGSSMSTRDLVSSRI